VVQRGQPGLQAQPFQYRAGQGRRFEAVGLPGPDAFRRQRQGQGGVVQGDPQVQADMSPAQLMTGQGRGQDQPGRGLRRFPPEKVGERQVERTQPAGLGPAEQDFPRSLALGVRDTG